MKPLPIKEQIKVLEDLLQNLGTHDLCCVPLKIVDKYGIQPYEYVSDYIPSITHQHYLTFYPTTRAVQKRSTSLCWDNFTIFGDIRRRRFVRHLIKELEKQLQVRDNP